MTRSMAPDHGTDHMLLAHIVVRGNLEPQLRAAAPECRIALDSGNILIAAHLTGQAQLYDILDRIRSVGATLVSLSVTSS